MSHQGGASRRVGKVVRLPQFCWHGHLDHQLRLVCGLPLPSDDSELRHLLRELPGHGSKVELLRWSGELQSAIHLRQVLDVRNTLVYTVITYVASIPLALLVSWCITNVARGRRFYEFVAFLPVVVSVVAVSLLFRMIMNPDTGSLNRILSAIGLPTSDWIFGSDSALISVAIVDVWKSLGFYVVLLAGAMLAVSPELQDAARVDGANGWASFRYVTIPSIMPTLALVSIFTVLNGLAVYATPTVLGPGPGTSTLMINQFIVDTAFTSFNMSLATATSVVPFAFMLIVTLIQLRVLRSKA